MATPSNRDVLTILLLHALLFANVYTEPIDYKDYALFELVVNNVEQQHNLEELEARENGKHRRNAGSRSKYGFLNVSLQIISLSDANAMSVSFEMVVSPEFRPTFEQALLQLNISYTIAESDINRLFSQERQPPHLKGLASTASLTSAGLQLDAYNRYEDLVNGYTSDEAINKWHWYVIPVLNPDGYEYSHTDDRLWRKNRNPWQTNCISEQRRRKRPAANPPVASQPIDCCVGVDLNRNFDWFWGKLRTSSSDSCSNTYRGKQIHSEPETQALVNFVQSHQSMLKAYFTIHAKGRYWLVPYGHDTEDHPSNIEELITLAEAGNTAMEPIRGTTYAVGSAWDLLGYLASGTSEDWVVGKTSLEYGYTMELATAWILPQNEILGEANDAWAGIKGVAEQLYASRMFCLSEAGVIPQGCFWV